MTKSIFRRFVALALTAIFALSLWIAASLTAQAAAEYAKPVDNWPNTEYNGFGVEVKGWGTHIGMDNKITAGSKVYAVLDGTVKVSGYFGAYGNNGMTDGTSGGAIIIEHKNSKGENFYALYGHVDNITVSVGAKVTNGQQIGTIMNLFYTDQGYIPHIHFGIATEFIDADTNLKGYKNQSFQEFLRNI